jgi:drug/metabolite transporter (DMT)-like permease
MSPRAWTLFLSVSLLWGVPYLLIKIAVDDLSPAVVVFARTALGAAILLPIAWRAGALRGLAGRGRDVLVLALTSVTIPFLLITAGEQWVSSSLTAILIAVEPMAIGLLAIRIDASERVGGSRMVGLAIGATGVVALLGLDLAGGLALIGAAMILAATACYAYASMQVRLRFSDVRPVGLAAATLTVSTVLLAGPAAATAPASPPPAGTLGALALLGAACTALAFVLYFALVREVGAGRASVITYAAPAVAVVLGVTLLGERLGGWALAGLALIAVGSWLSTRGGPAARPREAEGMAAG